uniref:Uncharacterized protein n=1 Tax=Geospiza parvula TaxID=87175 RepID=A0A8U8BDT4_GEOPR
MRPIKDAPVSLSCSLPTDATVPKPTQLIQGQLHGSVTVLCPSGDTQSDQKRFWCKVGRSSCTPIASSDGFVGRRYQGRIVITPQESSGAFKVLINDLKEEDSGLYLCGTKGLKGQDSPQEVLLQVATGRTGHGGLSPSINTQIIVLFVLNFLLFFFNFSADQSHGCCLAPVTALLSLRPFAAFPKPSDFMDSHTWGAQCWVKDMKF